MMIRTGWCIVCPDGKQRHFPYGNLGDAECDARGYERNGCAVWKKGVRKLTDCPGGKHTVEACSFEMPEPPASA